MLRSLEKGALEELQQIGNLNPGEVQSTQQFNHRLHGRLPSAVALSQSMMHSTTSLSTESSINSKSVHNQAVHQQQNHLPISRIPSQIRRRVGPVPDLNQWGLTKDLRRRHSTLHPLRLLKHHLVIPVWLPSSRSAITRRDRHSIVVLVL
jgi:hypothetical protein